MIQAPEFLNNTHHTGWLDARISAQVRAARHGKTQQPLWSWRAWSALPTHPPHPNPTLRVGPVGAAAVAPQRHLRHRAARAGPHLVPQRRVPQLPGERAAAACTHLVDYAAGGVCCGWCACRAAPAALGLLCATSRGTWQPPLPACTRPLQLPTHPPTHPTPPGVKYNVKAVRQGPQALRLHLGGTHVDVVVRKLNDGGLLVQVRGGRQVGQGLRRWLGGTAGQNCACPLPAHILSRHAMPRHALSRAQVDGSSHVVHSEEEALGTRLTIDSRTCLLSNEHDPSKVRRRRLPR